MSKKDKKKQKLQERLAFLEEQMRTSLGKKTHDSAEINIAAQMRKIADLRKQINEM